MPSYMAQTFISVEATPGTYNAGDLNATDLNHLEECDIQPIGDPVRRACYTEHQDRLPPAEIAARHGTAKIVQEVKASPAAGTAPESGNTWIGAGCQETIVPATSVTYAPYDDPVSAAYDESMTIRSEDSVDGRYYILFGARAGNLRLSWKHGDKLMLSSDWIGAYKRFDDLSALSTSTDNTGNVLAVMDDSTPFTIGGYAAIVRSFELVHPIQPTLRPHGGGTLANGFYKWPAHLVWPPDQHATISCEIELVDETAFAIMAKWEARTLTASDTVKWTTGSRSATLTMRNVAFDAPVLMRGTHNWMRLNATLSRSGTSPAWGLAFT